MRCYELRRDALREGACANPDDISTVPLTPLFRIQSSFLLYIPLLLFLISLFSPSFSPLSISIYISLFSTFLSTRFGTLR